jgi:kumamolisin
MKRWLSYLAAMAVVAVCGLGLAAGQQQPRQGTVVVPPSNAEAPEDIGRRAHTNFLIFVPAARSGKQAGPNASSGPSGETPGSLSCVYQTWAGQIPGCPINSNYTAPTSGGTNVIAIVDAYDYPTAVNDFQFFSKQFDLPSGNSCGPNHNAVCFTKVFATGSQPASNCGWAQEAALDIEWAHAMAPYAQIILVEAASNSNSDLMQAVQVASEQVAAAGGGEVSMSWGSSEFRTESTYDSYFTGSGVTYFASSGDSGGKVIWPSSSPNVVSAGGTTVNRDSSGNFTNETVWSGAGGGPSRYEPVPDYQSAIHTLAQLLGRYRGTPDLSFDANPATGVSVYDTTACQGLSGWMVFGGTSVSAPSLAGVVNLSGDFSGDNGVQSNIYQNYSTASSGGAACNYSSPFYDVTSGSAGRYSATGCWDYASGVGTARGLTGLGGSSSLTVSSLTLDPTSLVGGSSSTATVTLSGEAPAGGASVPLKSSDPTVAQVPANVTVNGGATSATLTVTTSSVSTSTDVTITASYNSSSQEATLTVNPAASSGDFSLSASPGNVTLKGGGTANYTVTVSPSGGFNGKVSFSVSGLPTGASSSIGTVTGSGSTGLSVNDIPSAKGSYTLTITGTSDSLTHAVSVGLKVR